MAFDRFLDIQDFGKAAHNGPYVGDEAVADMLIELLRERDENGGEPVFAFVITMENHGPMHLEEVAAGEFKSRHALGDNARWRDLTAYLRHVENADKMIDKLTIWLRKRERPTVLCFYGDHVPALGSVFDALGKEPVTSDYFIWRNFEHDAGTQCDTCVENLGSALQQAMMHGNSSRADLRNEMWQATTA
jgi:phosphoglycerol transferase MdoB-like AlkP superfamily enzyme